MAHALNTFHYKGALGTRMNPNSIVRIGELDLNTQRVDGEIFETRKKKLRIQKYLDTRRRDLTEIWKNNNKRKITFTVNLLKLYTLNCWIRTAILPNVSYSKFYQWGSLRNRESDAEDNLG